MAWLVKLDEWPEHADGPNGPSRAWLPATGAPHQSTMKS